MILAGKFCTDENRAALLTYAQYAAGAAEPHGTKFPTAIIRFYIEGANQTKGDVCVCASPLYNNWAHSPFIQQTNNTHNYETYRFEARGRLASL